MLDDQVAGGGGVADPGGVLSPLLTTGELGDLARVGDGEVVLHAEGVEDGDGHPLVAGGTHVHAVLVPVAPVAVLPHPPEVHDGRSVPVGGLADQLVVEREAAAQEAVRRGAARVEGGEHDHPGTGRGQARQPVVVRGDEHVDVDAGPQDVVGAGVDGHEVGLEGQGRLELLSEDRQQLATADREVGVAEVGLALGEHLGDAVGPAAYAVGPGRVGVADALGEGVAEGDVALEAHDPIVPGRSSSPDAEVAPAARGRVRPGVRTIG